MQESSFIRGGLSNSSWMERLNKGRTFKNWNLSRPKFPTKWSTNNGDLNGEENVDRESLEIINGNINASMEPSKRETSKVFSGDINRSCKSSKRRPERQRKLRHLILLGVLIVLGLIIAVLVPVLVVMVLPKGDTEVSVSKVDIEVKIQNMQYTDAFADKGSQEYIRLKDKFCSEIEKQYQTSDLADSYDGCVVTGVRNGSLIVTFSIVFISKNLPLQSRVKSVLTKSRVTLDTGQVHIHIGVYILDEASIVLGQVTVIRRDENPVPDIAYNGACRVDTSCKTEQAMCINRRCHCQPPRYYDAQADQCFLPKSPSTGVTTTEQTVTSAATTGPTKLTRVSDATQITHSSSQTAHSSPETISMSSTTAKSSASLTTIPTTSADPSTSTTVVVSHAPPMNRLEIGEVQSVIFQVVHIQNAAVITLERTNTDSVQLICNITFSSDRIEKTYGPGKRSHIDVSVNSSGDQIVANITLKFGPVQCNDAAIYKCRATMKEESTEPEETSVDMGIYKRAEKPRLTISHNIVAGQYPGSDRVSKCEGEVGYPAGYFVLELLTFIAFTNYTSWWPLTDTKVNETNCGTHITQRFVFYIDELDYLNNKQIRCAVRNDNLIPGDDLPVSDAKTIHVVQSDYCEGIDWKFYEHPFDCHAYVDCSNAKLDNLHFNLCESTDACPNRENGCDASTCATLCNREPLTIEEQCDNGATIIPHPRECQTYYNCSIGRRMYPNNFELHMQECRYPQLFSTNSMKCEEFETVDCGERHEMTDYCGYRENRCVISHCIPCVAAYPYSCAGKPDGMNALHKRRESEWSERSEWSEYFMTCYKERFISKDRCPLDTNNQTQLFHKDIRECVPLDMVPQEHGGTMPSCDGKDDGNYLDNMGRCNQFTVCKSGKIAEIVKCKVGEVFDEARKECLEYENACGPCGESNNC